MANGKWQFDYGYDATGKNPRRQFNTEEAADKVLDAYKKESKKKGEYWARLTPVKRDTIVATLQDGLTLDGVWADHRRWRKDNAQSITTPKAYEDVVTSHKKRSWKPAPSSVTPMRLRGSSTALAKTVCGRTSARFRPIVCRRLVHAACSFSRDRG